MSPRMAHIDLLERALMAGDLEEAQRLDHQVAMAQYDEAMNSHNMDEEFIPYLRRLANLSPIVTPAQSCIGHMPYFKRKAGTSHGRGLGRLAKDEFSSAPLPMPEGHTDKWGYLWVYADPRLMDSFDANFFPVVEGARWLYTEMARKEMLESGVLSVGVAWDAKWWPEPAEVVIPLLEEMANNFRLIS